LDSHVFHNQGSANERLWQAVIDSAVTEWVRGPERHKRKAEHFLFQDEDDFPFVCRSAGLNPESVRGSLWAIRAKLLLRRTRKSHNNTSPLSGPQPDRHIRSHIGPEKSCQFNRSMQHHLIIWSDNTSSREPICKAVLNQNLNRAVFLLHQRP
jgi:hypothetical protein